MMSQLIHGHDKIPDNSSDDSTKDAYRAELLPTTGSGFGRLDRGT